MRYIKIAIFSVISLILISLNLCLAQTKLDIGIKINAKDIFQVNDTLNFTYALTSNQDTEITYTPYISCELAPQPFLEEKVISLKANTPYQGEYSSIKVSDDFEPQSCVAFIRISSPMEKREEKEFKIEAIPSLEFNLNYCKDSACEEKTKVFILNDVIYLNYISEVENPEITAKLIYPDKTEKQITLPTSIKAEQAGNYELEITANKEGYKTTNKNDMFGVIAEQPQIKSASVCAVDGKCAGQENKQNCPQDCAAKKSKIFSAKIIGLAVLFVFIIVSIMYYLFIRKKADRLNN